MCQNIRHRVKWLTSSIALVLSAVLLACATATPTPPPPSASPHLVAHSEEFRQQVIRVTEGVYVAVGYGLANAILIEGETGVVIVDTLESVEAAIPARAAFDQITTLPVRAIIYTHHHEDHIFGAKVFAGDARPQVIAHARLMEQMQRSASVVREATFRRAAHQFGNLLPPEMVMHSGIGPFLRVNDQTSFGFIAPTWTFSGESTTLEIAGIRMELVLAPGETDDQILVWLPDRRVLLAADNIYKSFPNLYAIRGTPYRNVMQWVASLDRMRAYQPDHLVLGHGRPLSGAAHIRETLLVYRDAIQYVHDQTIRGINRGLSPDELVRQVKLPPHLAQHPYLQEYYGSVAWSVRAIYDGYLGWFDGNATHLFPLSPTERATRLATLVGGATQLREHAERAIAAQDYQWGLELLDHWLALHPEDPAARTLKAQALTALAERQHNATARNFYLTQAQVTTGTLSIRFKLQDKDKELLHHIPLRAIFAAMAVRLDPIKSAHVDQSVGFRFPDTGEEYTVHVRRGVAEIQPRFPDQPNLVITLSSNVWKEMLVGLRNPIIAFTSGEVQVQGNIIELVTFLRLFQDD